MFLKLLYKKFYLEFDNAQFKYTIWKYIHLINQKYLWNTCLLADLLRSSEYLFYDYIFPS